ncbi:MAG: hypothetical protein K6L73_12910 [Cellvibrionaceae bacterium]
MKLVLLPGMDGTGKLFEDFLSCLQKDHVIIPLPEGPDQSYRGLAEYISEKLPNESHIILAESFSGGLIPHLLNKNNPHIKGVIFAASFINCPKPLLCRMAKLIPLKVVNKLPRISFLYQQLLLGKNSSSKTLNIFKKIISDLPKDILNNRLSSLRKLKPTPINNNLIPCVYIKATKDYLVPARKSEEISRTFRNIEIIEVRGPHFILQAQPEECAAIVKKAINRIEKSPADY